MAGDEGVSDVTVLKALSSGSRWDILRSLFIRPMSVSEIAEEVGLQPVTVRHHLQPLIQIGLVEAYEGPKGSVGRPEVYYRVTEKRVNVSFPKRDYMYLTEILISGLEASLGEEETRKIFTQIAEEAGQDIMKNLATEHNIEAWTPEVFRKVFIEGLLKNAGTEPEVVTMNEKEIVFRERNCLFLEVAMKHPETVCDGLDTGVHSGIIRGMGEGVKGERLQCRGHGDTYCEYAVKWE